MSGSDVEYQRIIWHSRRGMLELDLVLEPFVRQRYLALSDSEQADYRALLDCQDQELFDWFLQKARPETEQLCSIVDKVLEHQRARDLSEPFD